MTAQTASTAVQQAVTALARGKLVLMTDDADQENQVGLVCAAEYIDPASMAFMVRHTTGIVCVPMSASRAGTLPSSPRSGDNTDSHGTAFTVPVDQVATGAEVLTQDLSTTVRALADAVTSPANLRRPGHEFPLRPGEGGVMERTNYTEAAVDLATMAGLSGVAVIGEVVDEDGLIRSGESVARFAAEHDLPAVAIADLIRHRVNTERFVVQVGISNMPTEFGEFRAMAYRSIDGTEHLALVKGDVAAAGESDEGALVRVHSECLTGDIVGSLRCDCGAQLEQALVAIAAEGAGAVIYLRGHEGRGIGLGHKIRAYALQERGLDTVEANIAQGLPVDSRTYGVGAQILADLGIRRLRLITNNPAKSRDIAGRGLVVVDRVALPTRENPHNIRYLRTKQQRLHHEISLSESNPEV